MGLPQSRRKRSGEILRWWRAGEQTHHGDKGTVTHLEVVVQLQRLEILEFAQIPEFDGGVVGRRGQVVAVLREGDAGDGARVAGEIGHVGAFLGIKQVKGLSNQ